MEQMAFPQHNTALTFHSTVAKKYHLKTKQNKNLPSNCGDNTGKSECSFSSNVITNSVIILETSEMNF